MGAAHTKMGEHCAQVRDRGGLGWGRLEALFDKRAGRTGCVRQDARLGRVGRQRAALDGRSHVRRGVGVAAGGAPGLVGVARRAEAEENVRNVLDAGPLAGGERRHGHQHLQGASEARAHSRLMK